MTNQGRADAVMLGVMGVVLAAAAPLGAVLLQWSVGWANGWFGFDPPIPTPGFWTALGLSIGCGVCIWLVNGVATGLAEGLVDGVYGEYLGQAIAAPLCFILLTLLYVWFLPATLVGAAVVAGIMHAVGFAAGLVIVFATWIVFRRIPG